MGRATQRVLVISGDTVRDQLTQVQLSDRPPGIREGTAPSHCWHSKLQSVLTKLLNSVLFAILSLNMWREFHVDMVIWVHQSI